MVILSSDPASAGQVSAPAAFSGEGTPTPESNGRILIHMRPQYVLGSEFAGRIAKDSPIPKGCPFKPGDRVFGSGQGAYGERVATTWKLLVPLPDNMTYEQGAGEPFNCSFVVTHFDRNSSLTKDSLLPGRPATRRSSDAQSSKRVG